MLVYSHSLISSTDSTAYMSYAELISPLEDTNQLHILTRQLSNMLAVISLQNHPAIGRLAL